MSARPIIRWGILGCARIARRGLIPGLAASRTGALIALGSRVAARARAWSDEFGISRAYGSFQAVLDDPDIDAVYVPLPNELHKPWVLAAADAGKHVLCEKPLALDAREAMDMVERCRTRGVMLMEAFMWRHQPRTKALRRMVGEGQIGELRLIRSSFSFPIDPADWRLDRLRGGGALWDVGCYGVNMARLFAGAEPARSLALARMGGTGVDLSLAALLEFPGGALASIDCSFEQPFRCHYELVGTCGLIQVEDAYLPPAASMATARLCKLAARSGFTVGRSQPRLLKFEPVNQYAVMVDAFARSIAAGRLIDPAEDGLAQMIALEQVMAAAAR